MRAAALCLALAACSPCRTIVAGACVEVDEGVTPEQVAAVTSLVAPSLAYFSARDLDGWTIHLRPDGARLPFTGATGTCELEEREIEVRVFVDCPLETPLPHEILHALRGDPDHTRENWDLRPLWDALHVPCPALDRWKWQAK